MNLGSLARVENRRQLSKVKNRTWYGLVAQSFDGPDMTVYVELDFYVDLSLAHAADADAGRRHTSLSSSVIHAPPLELERPALHLLVHHELQRTVAHANQREQSPTIEPAPTLIAEYHPEPACWAHTS